MSHRMSQRHFIFTGPPGAGKTSVLDVLPDDVRTVPEAARRVIAAQRAQGDQDVGDADPLRFLALMKDQCLADIAAAPPETINVYDRALPDLVAYAAFFGVPRAPFITLAQGHRFAPRVFWFAAWPDIYVTDEDRKATPHQLAIFSDALRAAYLSLDYELINVPRASVAERAAFVARHIEL
jgi:predicted ATPase